jgi:hypothetical protein
MPDLPLSEAGHAILTPVTTAILRDAGESAYRLLVVKGPTPALATQLLAGVKTEQLFSRPIKQADDAAAAMAGLWLWLDGLGESHAIAQDLVSGTGSFWHAIMHRREGDFSNAKYWYRRCSGHHVTRLMGAIASSLVKDFESDRLVARVVSDGWNPNGLVDLVEAVHDKPHDPRHDLAVKLQQLEWTGLFDYCIHEAVEAERNDLDGWDRRVNQPS